MSATAQMTFDLPIQVWDESQIVQSALALPGQGHVADWVERNIRLGEKDSQEPGMLRIDRTPYLREILEYFRDPAVQEITLMFGTQLAKTTFELACILYAACEDPGNAMYVMPTEKVARGIMEKRIKPLISQSAAVYDQLIGEVEDIDQLGVEFLRMYLIIAWANSPASLASYPCRYVFLDEIDKYPRFSGRESDPAKLASERSKNFWNRKTVKASTPTTSAGYIHREYLKSDQRQNHVPCPHCGAYRPFRWKQIKWPESERDPNRIYMLRLAWYQCEVCLGRIEDRHKEEMLARGVWCPRDCAVDNDGKIVGDVPMTSHRGYWLNSIYSPWLTFSDVAREFLESKDDPEKLMNFVNSWLAEVWSEKINEPVSVGDLVRLKSDAHQAGKVPDWCVALFAGVDVQHDRMYFVVKGVGYDERTHLVMENWVDDFPQLDEQCTMALFEREGDGARMPVYQVCIDSGHRTDQVYLYARQHGERVRAVKGASHTQNMTANYQATRVERMLRTKDQQGRMTFVVWLLNKSYYLDKIHRLRTAQPSLWSLHANVSDDYLQQSTGYQKIIERNTRGVPRSVWAEGPGVNGNVHFADCDYYCQAAADMRGASLWKPQEPKPKRKNASGGLLTPDGRPFLATKRDGGY